MPPFKNKQYTNKYPQIIMDSRKNSANTLIQKRISVEDWNDLLHHTHNASDLVIDSEGTTYSDMQNTIAELNKNIDSFNTTIYEQQSTINDLKIAIAYQQNTIDELKNIIENQNNTISEYTVAVESLSKEVANIPSVSDWDVDKPGKQDSDGNDLGTLMGFQMTEIVE